MKLLRATEVTGSDSDVNTVKNTEWYPYYLKRPGETLYAVLYDLRIEAELVVNLTWYKYQHWQIFCEVLIKL